jgi:hypothetical protein
MPVAEIPSLSELPYPTTEKTMQTFRLPREVVAFLRAEATQRGLDLTAYVTRILDGFRTYYGLPAAEVSLLDTDRDALRMGRYEYMLHVLFQRHLELRKKGPGFDTPRAAGGVERKRG